jgi:hypothetical protein
VRWLIIPSVSRKAHRHAHQCVVVGATDDDVERSLAAMVRVAEEVRGVLDLAMSFDRYFAPQIAAERIQGAVGIRQISAILSIVLGVGIVAPSVVAAQVSTGQISGRVTDTSGAVLPGVSVTATQTDTQAVRTTVTNEVGAFTLANLPIGPYRLEAMLQGF